MDNWMYQPSSRAGDSSTQPIGTPPPPTNNSSSSSNINATGSSSASRDEAASPEGRSAAHIPPGQSRIRRRNRTIASCLECRRRKLKCDKQAPCTNCTRFKRDCLYLASSLDAVSQQKLADIKEKMGALERNLEREVAGQMAVVEKPPKSSSSSVARPYDLADDVEDAGLGAEDEENLEAPPWTTADHVYEDDGDGDDEIVDLGVQMGRMRVTERIGGWVRPQITSELTHTLEDRTKAEKDPTSSIFQFAAAGTETRQQSRDPAASKSYIGPGPDYIAPSSSFLFPGTNMGTALMDYLPSKKAADLLIAQYYHFVHPICTTVHLPTFQAAYAAFWDQIVTGATPPASRQAIIFAAMFSAAVSFTEEDTMQRFSTTKASLVDSLRSGTEFALCKANLLRATKFETMQAFVMYLIPQIRGEISRAHSALVGTAIRLAECMGLHRDGTHYNMTAIETQSRRLVWCQLCFLDFRTCETTGPRPHIRQEDYDTQLPWNVDDVDLINATVPPVEKNVWTDATFMRERAEITNVRRQLWFDCTLLDKKKKSLTSTLIKIQKLRTSLAERYLPLLDDSYPLQKMAKVLLRMLLSGMFITILHRYLPNTANPLPDRLRQILIESGVDHLEGAIELDRNPVLKPWVWYRGAFNTFHVALLLLIEIHEYPMRKEGPRIWKSLDYVFDVPPQLSPKQKGDLILTDLRDRMAAYHEMRKLRSTTHMSERLKEIYVDTTARRSTADDSTAATATATAPTSAPVAGLPSLGSLSGNAPIPPPAMPQISPSQSPPMMAPASFMPSPQTASETDNSAGRSNSLQTGNDTQMMDDIDWAEWDKYFPLESNTGDLNIPDFDFANYTAGYNNASLNQSGFTADTARVMPSINDLSDVHFTPTYFAAPTWQQNSSGQNQGGNSQGANRQRTNYYPGSWMGV